MKIVRTIIMVLFCIFIININTTKVYCGHFFTMDQLDEWIEEKNKLYESYGYTVDNGTGSVSSDLYKGQDETNVSCDHTYTSEVTKEPTCIEPGITTYTCSKCGNTYTEEIPATGEHSYEEEVTKQPTCTENGETTYTCSVCGDTYTEEIPALGHDYEETITKEATCTEAGEKTYICKTCGDSYTEEIAALGHTEGDWEVTKQAGLFSKGEQIKKCSSCGEILVTETIESKYPLSYLFIGIIALLLVIAVIVVYLVKKKKINIFVKSDEALE